METRGLKNGMVELVADPGKRLHLKDTDIYAAKAPVAPGSVGAGRRLTPSRPTPRGSMTTWSPRW